MPHKVCDLALSHPSIRSYPQAYPLSPFFLYPATDIHPTANNFQHSVNITFLKLPQTPHLTTNKLQSLINNSVFITHFYTKGNKHIGLHKEVKCKSLGIIACLSPIHPRERVTFQSRAGPIFFTVSEGECPPSEHKRDVALVRRRNTMNFFVRSGVLATALTKISQRFRSPVILHRINWYIPAFRRHNAYSKGG
jgi:hypothetical protein